MNINLQFVNNDIKLNNILFGQNSNNNNIPNIGKNEANRSALHSKIQEKIDESVG